MKVFAPIVVFAYRRPDHLRHTLTSLLRCHGFENHPVIVYCDGARSSAELDAVMATREVALEMFGEQAEFHFSDANLGLSKSLISGITATLEKYDRVIVIEDDLELSPDFLTYMNDALAKFADEKKVFQVSGYMFDVKELAGSQEALFLPFTVSWGWGAWRRAWQHFDPFATGWQALQHDPILRQRFNLDGAFDYASMMFRQLEGKRDSWAIRWYWSVFKADGLVLFPPESLVRNNGFDGSGSHGRGWFRHFSTPSAFDCCKKIRLPESVNLSEKNLQLITNCLRQKNGGVFARTVDAIRRLLRS